jgi:hypothetical protein
MKGSAAWLKKRIFGRVGSSRLGPGKRVNSGALESDDSDATPQSRTHSMVCQVFPHGHRKAALRMHARKGLATSNNRNV